MGVWRSLRANTYILRDHIVMWTATPMATMSSDRLPLSSLPRISRRPFCTLCSVLHVALLNERQASRTSSPRFDGLANPPRATTAKAARGPGRNLGGLGTAQLTRACRNSAETRTRPFFDGTKGPQEGKTSQQAGDLFNYRQETGAHPCLQTSLLFSVSKMCWLRKHIR